MGKEKKHKDKDKSREHKKKKKHRSRSRSRDRSDKKHKHRDRSRSRDRESRKRKHDRDDYDDYGGGRHSPDADVRVSGSVQIPGLGDLPSTDRYSDHNVKQEDPYGVSEELQKYASGYYEDGEVKEEPGMQGVTPSGYADPPMDTNPPASSGGNDSLSIEETNKLRAKLGMKPLDVPDSADTGEEKKANEDVHVPAVNIRDVKKRAELKEKLLQAKEKRKINQLLGKVKTLGEDSDDEDDALAWVKKSRKKEKEKKIAEKRAKLLDEMDSEFGIGNLVDEEFGVKKEKDREYTAKDLRGLTVKHDQVMFKEGKTVILTLEDKGVLDEDGENDVLMNVNIADDERAGRNIENKKAKPDYNPYDEEFDEYGMPKPKQILSKYDEDIDGNKKDKKTFKLEGGGMYKADHERLMQQMQQDMNEQKQALVLPAPVMASEYYTEQEMASFKKVKKKVRKVRKKVKAVRADDLIPLGDEGGQDLGRRGAKRPAPIDPELADRVEKTGSIPGLDFVESGKNADEEDDDVQGPEEDLTGVVVDDEAGTELQKVLEKTRKLKQKTTKGEKKVVEHLSKLPQQEEMDSDSDNEDKLTLISGLAGGAKANITLNQTSEFCRALGEIPTYGQAGNRMEDEDELMDFERELQEERRRKEIEENADNPGWKQVEIDTAQVDIDTDEQVVLEEEPVVGKGMAATLSLATKKGYLVQEKIKYSSSAPRHKDLEAKNYSIEDKRYEDLDEKFRKRDRYGGGIISDFKEKEGYKPDVKLDYVDEMGREMSAKEAFRYLSHRFHGKGSGKMKQEKRKKKRDEEELMKSMSSTDTPLGTASMLEEKLAREKTPYLQLSGGNKTLTGAGDRIAK